MLLASLPDFAALDWSALVWTDVVARLHPLVLHLPIGLLTLLFAAEVWSLVRRNKGERDGTRGLLVLLLFLTGPVAALSGWLLRTDGYVDIEWHRNLGIAVGVFSVLIALTYWGKTRAYGTLVFLGFGTMVAAAHLGATITHGEEFLFEPWHAAAKAPAQPELYEGGGETTEPVDSMDPAVRGAETASLVSAGTGAELASADTTELAGTDEDLPPVWADVEPIFADLCTKCHGTRKQKGELALHSEGMALLGGENGPVITPEDWRSSPLLQVIALPLDHDDHMPPAEKLQPSAEQLATLQAWIAGLAGEVPTPEDSIEFLTEEPGTPVEDQASDSAPSESEPPTTAESSSAAVAVDVSPEALLAASEAERGRREAHASETFEAYVARLSSQQVVVTPLTDATGADDSDAPIVRLNLTAYELTPAGLGEVLTGGPRQLREVVLFGQDLSWSDLFVLRQAAAEDGGLETLELRNLKGAPLDLAHLAAPAFTLDAAGTSSQADATHHLRHLNLAGTKLAPGAVAHLAALPQLETVHLWGTSLGDADLAELAALRPGLVITGASAPLDEPVEVEPEVVFTKAGVEPTGEPGATGQTPPALVAENDTCPVSGSPVDPRYTVAYEGRLIGFCCTNCPKTFWADPEAFLAKLDAE